MGNARSTRTIAIIGTGMIASGFAVLMTGHGFTTVVLSRSAASTERLKAAFEANWTAMLAHGVTTEERVAAACELLVVTEDYADLADAEAVFESVTEDIEVKREVFAAIEANCPNVKAICSASSSIITDRLAECCDKYADRVLVAHPFNPAHMVPYVEVCAGAPTDPAAVEYTMALLEELDKKPVLLKKPTPGFIGNRLQFALWREALQLVEEGICEPRDIDTALAYGWGPRFTSIGIFEHFDNGGMFLNRATCESVFPILGDTKEVPPVIDKLIAEGHTGAKAGQGFYDWRDVDMEAYNERVFAPYWKFCNWE